MQSGHQSRNKGSKAWKTCTNYQDHACKQAKKEKNKINTTFGWSTIKRKHINIPFIKCTKCEKNIFS